MRWTLLAAALLAGACGMAGISGNVADPPGDTFPDEWFFDGAQRPAALKSLEGKPAVGLTTESWIGSEVQLRDQRGKVVVIDFWATWCGPCIAAIPENIELVNQYKDKGLVFIGVHDSNSGWDRADAVVKDKGINYAVAKDKSGGVSATDYKVQFWPTYVVVDRKGIVRAAGLIPNRVEEVVKALLAESGPSDAEVQTGFGPDFYYGGANRPSGLRAMEGKPAPAPSARAWLGMETPASQWEDSIVVLHFTAPKNIAAVKQLGQIAAVEKEYANQGVVFIGVCDAGGDWAAMEAAAKAAKLGMPFMHDAAIAAPGGGADAEQARGGEGGAAPKPGIRGITAKAYGVQFFPATIVIDRAGTIRAAGVRVEKAKEVLERLLAEKAG